MLEESIFISQVAVNIYLPKRITTSGASSTKGRRALSWGTKRAVQIAGIGQGSGMDVLVEPALWGHSTSQNISYTGHFLKY